MQPGIASGGWQTLTTAWRHTNTCSQRGDRSARDTRQGAFTRATTALHHCTCVPQIVVVCTWVGRAGRLAAQSAGHEAVTARQLAVCTLCVRRAAHLIVNSHYPRGFAGATLKAWGSPPTPHSVKVWPSCWSKLALGHTRFADGWGGGGLLCITPWRTCGCKESRTVAGGVAVEGRQTRTDGHADPWHLHHLLMRRRTFGSAPSCS